ncbi:hypothetical protein [Magnetospirillum sp. LM-5]|uniref:hypothetical protein n=1 Tax=Magnetospirillum sp. LM-5 TaxID=2681466 RepID=UPI001570C649|nr:hypothetical protein [Magnetospirillum sp. LM-5]
MRALYIAVGIGVMAAPASAQQQGPDILTIWDQFSVSNTIASKCVKPEEDKLTKFLVNFQIVTINASLRIQQLRPDWTPERIDQAMKERYGQIDKSMAAVIAQETCEGPKVKEALRRFDFQAGIDFTGANKPK